ncbi:MAG: RNA polymerase sigma factor [Ruminococcus sp.]|nr:RNA polymerase sigma factor [Ruminococcus sp.]
MGSITEETVSRAAGGDHAAFNEIYHAYESGLRSYITLHLSDKSQAEDVLQNTFVAVFKNIGQLKNPAGIKSWLYKIAYNECMTVNGAVKRDSERYAPMSSFADEDGSEREFADDRLELPEDFAANAELQRLLTKTLNSLLKAQRDCLVLCYYRQKPVAEIAEMPGVTENAVKLRKKNALDKLRRKLEKYRGSYNFALAPMGLFVGKLVGTGKVKSAYAGAALVRSATAGVAAACVAGAVGITAVGYFGLNRDDEKIRIRTTAALSKRT